MSVEDYLASLPNDTTEIDISGRGLTVLPDLSRFNDIVVLNCSNNDLKTLNGLPQCIDTIYCTKNPSLKITQVPHDLLTLYCNRNQLTSGLKVKRIVLSS